MADIAVLNIRINATQANIDLGRLNAALGNSERQARTAERTFSSLSSVMATFGGVLAGISFASLISEFIAIARASESLNLAFSSVFNSAAAGAKELDFVRGVANRLGVEIESTATAYVRLAAAAQGTALEGQSIRTIFEQVAEASAVMGLSAANTTGILNALQQIVSKQVVSMEELRLQLGDRLPGALRLAAESTGLATGEFIKMVATGQILANDFLPGFAKAISESMGNGGKEVQTLGAEIGRLKNTFFELGETLNEGFGGSILGGAIQAIQQFTKESIDGIKAVDNLIGGTVDQWSDAFEIFAKVLATAGIAAVFIGITAAVKGLIVAMAALRTAFLTNPFGAFVTFVGLAVGALVVFRNELAATDNFIGKVVRSFIGLDALTSKVAINLSKQDAAERLKENRVFLENETKKLDTATASLARTERAYAKIIKSIDSVNEVAEKAGKKPTAMVQPVQQARDLVERTQSEVASIKKEIEQDLTIIETAAERIAKAQGIATERPQENFLDPFGDAARIQRETRIAERIAKDVKNVEQAILANDKVAKAQKEYNDLKAKLLPILEREETVNGKLILSQEQYNTIMAEAKKKIDDATAARDKGTVADRKSAAEQKKLTTAYEAALKAIDSQRASLDKRTAAAKLAYDLEIGKLKELSPLQKERLRAEQEITDALVEQRSAQEKFTALQDELEASTSKLSAGEQKRAADLEIINNLIETQSNVSNELVAAHGGVIVSTEEIAEVNRKSQAELEKTREEFKKAELAADPWAQAIKKAVLAVEGAFSSLFTDALNGFQDFGDKLLKGFLSILDDMAAAALRSKIFIPIVASVFSRDLAALTFGEQAVTAALGPAGIQTGGAALAPGTSSFGGSGISSLSSFLNPTGTGFGQAASGLFSGGAAGAVGGIPNFAFGLAGLGGGLIGSQLFGGGLGAGIGGSLGSTAGLVGGTAIGSSLTGLGATLAGPIGAVVGGILGSALGSLFGGGDEPDRIPFGVVNIGGGNFENDPQNRVLLDAITGASGLQFQGIGKFGGEQFAQELQDALVGIDTALTALAPGTNLAGRNLGSFGQFRRGFLAGGEPEGDLVGSLEDVTAEFVRVWVDASEVVTERVKKLFSTVEGDATELTQAFGAFQILTEFVEAGSLRELVDQLNEAEPSLYAAANAQRDFVFELLNTVDAANVNQLAQLGDAVAIRYQQEIQLVQQITTMIASVGAIGKSAVDQFTFDLLDAEGRFERFRSQAEQFRQQAANAEDPAEIFAAYQNGIAAQQQAWAQLNDEQRRAVQGTFITFAQEFEREVTARLGDTVDRIDQEHTRIASAIEAGLLGPIERMFIAAQQMEQAANTMNTAANTPNQVQVEVITSGGLLN